MHSQSISDAFLRLDGAGVVSAKYSQQEIDVSVRSTAIGELKSPRKNAKYLLSINVLRELLVTHHGFIVIRFRFKNEVSPTHVGLSAGSRNPVVALRALGLKPADLVEPPCNDLRRKPNRANNQ